MEIKIKNHTLIALGVIVLVVLGIIVLSTRGVGGTPAPYAGVKGADLPAVVGETALGVEKIPFRETENYKEYTPAILVNALKSGKATLLYFYADWCTSCRTQEPWNADFFQQVLKKKLPLVGIRINIDSNEAPKQQYGTHYSHSFVLLDKEGKTVKKFYGDHQIEELFKEVKAVL